MTQNVLLIDFSGLARRSNSLLLIEQAAVT